MKVITGRGLIWLCVIVLLLVCDGNKVYSNTSSSAAIFEDVEAALAMRSTDRSLVYLFSISHAKSILTLAMNSSLPVTEKDVFCFDLNQDTGDDVLLEIDSVALARSSSSFPFTFLLVSGVESLETEKEVGKLNFLHSVTDANSVYVNLVVVLIWDPAVHAIPATSATDTEDYLLNFFGKGGAKMNPTALYGRISTIAVSSSNPVEHDHDLELEAIDLMCQPHETAASVPPTDSNERKETSLQTHILRAIFMICVMIWKKMEKNDDPEPEAAANTEEPVPVELKTPTKKDKKKDNTAGTPTSSAQNPRRSARKKTKAKYN